MPKKKGYSIPFSAGYSLELTFDKDQNLEVTLYRGDQKGDTISTSNKEETKEVLRGLQAFIDLYDK